MIKSCTKINLVRMNERVLASWYCLEWMLNHSLHNPREPSAGEFEIVWRDRDEGHLPTYPHVLGVEQKGYIREHVSLLHFHIGGQTYTHHILQHRIAVKSLRSYFPEYLGRSDARLGRIKHFFMSLHYLNAQLIEHDRWWTAATDFIGSLFKSIYR